MPMPVGLFQTNRQSLHFDVVGLPQFRLKHLMYCILWKSFLTVTAITRCILKYLNTNSPQEIRIENIFAFLSPIFQTTGTWPACVGWNTQLCVVTIYVYVVPQIVIYCNVFFPEQSNSYAFRDGSAIPHEMGKGARPEIKHNVFMCVVTVIIAKRLLLNPSTGSLGSVVIALKWPNRKGCPHFIWEDGVHALHAHCINF